MRLLIDTDPGIDDALALLLALASTAVTVEAITTVAGNVPIDLATANALRVLAVHPPRSPVRVARGAAAPLARPLVTATHFHGDDGLGNIDRLAHRDGDRRYPGASVHLEMLDAADLILDVARQLGPELVIVALGPLTNLAHALARDRTALERVGRIVVMGGAVGVPGNITPAAEFNFYVDPEAAAAVLEAGLPVELVPLDVTRQVALTPSAVAERLSHSGDPILRFVADVTAHCFDSPDGDRTFHLHDPLAVGLAMDASLARFEPFHVEVECEGRATRGLSLADRRPLPPNRRRAPNCRVAVDVDAARFLARFLDALCPASR